MQMIFKNLELGSYNLHSAGITGPDYDDFGASQKVYFRLDSEVLLFDNCFGIQYGSSINLLNEYREVLVVVPSGFTPCALYELDSSLWKDLTNEQRKRTSYLLEEDVRQEGLIHYFFQENGAMYWHILSNEFRVLPKEEDVSLRKEFNVMSEKVFVDKI